MLKESSRVKLEMVEACGPSIAAAVAMVVDCLKTNHKVMICGNGGSAADAQHFAAEFVNRYKINRDPWPVMALHTDTSALTSIGNDAGFEYIYAKQIQAFGQPRDVLVVLTTSDIPAAGDSHSQNLAQALAVARHKKIQTIGLVSLRSQRILEFLDIAISVPSTDTPRIQEGHGVALHCICELAEQSLV